MVLQQEYLVNAGYERAVDFLDVFGNYKRAEELISSRVSDMDFTKKYATHLQGHVDLTRFYTETEKYVYSRAGDIYFTKDALPFLEGQVNTARILAKAEESILQTENSHKILEKLMYFYDTKYFSKPKTDDYMLSKSTFSLLMQEIDGCKGLSPKSAKIKEDIFTDYVSRKYSASKCVAWKELVADFPDRQAYILEQARQYIQQPYHSYNQWSYEIQSAISSINRIKDNLRDYIRSEIPDAEGQQLAKQYLAAAVNIGNGYSADLLKAKNYEDFLVRESNAIQDKIKDEMNYYRLTVPPYKIVSKSSGYQEDTYKLELSYMPGGMLKTFSVDYDNRFGNGYIVAGVGWCKSFSNKE